MPNGETSEAVSADAAASALAYLTEMSPDLRAGAILAADGAVLAASDRPERWREDVERWREDVATLLEVADGAGGEPIEQAHIATEQGEVFAVRHAGMTAVAVTERFALASLLFFDMRAVLRDLSEGGDGKGLDAA
jgi:predicted regulator of Ras-like GTPase activity (Roadblock/LC7/MglB family)